MKARAPYRIQCRGPGDERPCPAHAWWYSRPGKGNQRRRCGYCATLRHNERLAADFAFLRSMLGPNPYAVKAGGDPR